MNYSNDIKIDESALDVEWLNQPSLMYRYAKHEADGRRALDIAESVFDIEKAEIETAIRVDPESYGIPKAVKITEAVIRNALIQNKQYKEAEITLLNARLDYAYAKAGVKAIDARKSALEALVKLHGQQYFAGPSIPRDLSKEWENAEKEKRRLGNISKSLKRTKNN